ncbi:MAG: bifunctional folylpolyglutamate synthase/dihydrofolate synthase [Flavobacteriaceae bacterium]|nr:bifunctional folylpolyglutamate synthase/dihydrofolate synthase [Flavobacteriaceae bacterium]
MTYQATLDWLFSKLPMYQKVGTAAFKKDLTNILALSKHLDNPHKKFSSIHVAGTNGKGSTSHMLASVLQEAGYKVGLYTSPHLKDFRERIKINGQEISKQFVTDFVKDNKAFLEQQGLSFFEMTVGMAFHYFALQNVDVAIVEVGLGGRLDSTNIITPVVSVITNISLDHTQMLGNTLVEIATEKAGVIKPNTPVVVGEKQEEVASVFIARSKELNSPIEFALAHKNLDYQTDLNGIYQLKNFKTANTVLNVIAQNDFIIPDKAIIKGFLNVVKNTGFRGRWQILNDMPKVICDTAHNLAGLTYVMQQLKKEVYENLHIVLGTVADKNLEFILPLFPKNAIYYFCKPNIPRGLDAAVLQEKALKFNLSGRVYSCVETAYKSALNKALKKDFIFIGGSNFVVAEVL